MFDDIMETKRGNGAQVESRRFSSDEIFQKPLVETALTKTAFVEKPLRGAQKYLVAKTAGNVLEGL